MGVSKVNMNLAQKIGGESLFFWVHWLASEGMDLQREVLDINCSCEEKFPDL